MKYLISIPLLFLCLVGKGQTIVGSETFESESVGEFTYDEFNFEWFSIEGLSKWVTPYIVDEGGEHGKILMLPYAEGWNQEDHTLQLQISLTGQQKDELYLAFDIKLNSGFVYEEQYKFPGGFSGGEWVYIDRDPTDTATNGFITSWLMKGSYFQSFNYDISRGSTNPDHIDFSNSDISVDSLNNGWARVTMRIKINQPYGTANDFIEYGLNGRWFARHDNLLFRAWTNQNECYIDYINFWFFKSPWQDEADKNDTIKLDNIDCYFLEPSDPDYVEDTNTIGSTYSEVKATYDLYPETILPDSTYISASDTFTVTKHGVVSPAYKTQTTQIYSSGATYIDITFDKYSLQRSYSVPGWVKVYTGYGISKHLENVYTYPDEPNGTIRIYDSVATIEYYTGQDGANGFTIFYTSDGTGGGDLPNNLPDTLYPTDDAHTGGGSYADINYGIVAEMQVRYNNSGGNSDYDWFIHLLFDRSSITDSIIEAILNIHINSISDEGTYILRNEGVSWDESTITNNNKPSITSIIDTVTYSGSGWQQIDVTNYLQDSAIGNLISFEMWGLGGTSPYPVLYLSSKEGTNPPFIELTLYDEISPTGDPQDTILLTDTLFATQIDSFYNCQLQVVNGDTTLGYLDVNDWAKINNVDFTGSSSLLIIRNIVHPDYRGNPLDLYIDSIEESTKIASYIPESTGDWETFGFEIVELDSVPTGIHDLYIYSEQFAAGNIAWITSYQGSSYPDTIYIHAININGKRRLWRDPQTGQLYEIKLIFP